MVLYHLPWLVSWLSFGTDGNHVGWEAKFDTLDDGMKLCNARYDQHVYPGASSVRAREAFCSDISMDQMDINDIRRLSQPSFSLSSSANLVINVAGT